MAVFTQRLRNQFNAANHKEFIMDGADEAADLAALPDKSGCAIGSLAKHIKTGNVFILSSENKWVPYPFAKGSGGGGDDPSGSDDWSDIDGSGNESDYDWEGI